MGDRALIQFTNSNGEVSPVCYLHWNGAEAPEWIRDCAKLMESSGENLPYAFARFVGICHERISGNVSLGVWNRTDRLTEKDSHGDAGCYLVNVSTWEVEAFGGYGRPFNAREQRTVYICNAFSLSMLDRESQGRGAARTPLPLDDPGEFLTAALLRGAQIKSVVGHADTARVFSQILGREVEPNRASIRLAEGDVALVGQYIGPRLPEGATELPEGARIEWWAV